MLSSFQAFAFSITTEANISTPENTAKVIDLTTDVNSDIGFTSIDFAILPGADANKFTLAGNKLTFKATDFEARSDVAYRVKVQATKKVRILGVVASTMTAEKTITVTVADLDDEALTNIQISNTNLIAGLPADTLVGTLSATDLDTAADALTFTTTSTDFKIVNGNELETKRSITAIGDMTITVTVSDGIQSANQEFSIKVTEKTKDTTVEEPVVTAQAVRKESKSASKLLLSKVGRTLMGRLSHIRHKNKQKSSFSANDFVNGIQVSFADSQTNSFINRVLSANGPSNVIPTSSRKVERWDTWTSAEVVIGKNNGEGANKTKFNLKSLNIGMDRRIAKDKIIGFSLGLGKQKHTATGNNFSGDIDTMQYILSSYGALELNDKGNIEAVLGVAQATHKISNSNTPSADQDSDGFFASIAYRTDLQAQGVDLSPFIRYDISRIKMKADDILTNSETATDEAIALGIEINKQVNYQDGQLTRFVSVEYKSDIRRDDSDYRSKNAEQEVSVKLGLDYQKDDTTASVSYKRIQSTNNKAHSNGIEGAVRWKF
ncbi:[weak similarity to] outer membraneautotransporter_ [Bathymodiolus azoricus thioautotrophic gill symbiont]|uniref:[weak similarity to] outer membraneautotransporter n=1 Tax=Bathymodiolus azoricus thioautotrophic gill symbiont TaxID=235205 RepID=A0A1H6MAZ7_9GAMM|nr:[weak similarity to] outer membraneautotransporter_ [Bathymodiolus azoricus thioautotrophic gill symbiont]